MVDEAVAPLNDYPYEDVAEYMEDDEDDGDWQVLDNIDDVASDQDVDMLSQDSFGPMLSSQGKGKLVAPEDKPFPIMDLPAEIRLEIYRACLTRPYKIMLSRVERPPESIKPHLSMQEKQPGSDADDEESGEEHRSASNILSLPRTASVVRSARNNRIGLIPRSSLDAGRSRTYGQRNGRTSRLWTRPSSASGSSATPSAFGFGNFPPSQQAVAGNTPVMSQPAASSTRSKTPPLDTKPKNEDPLLVNILRTSKEVYKEARDVLYSENVFDIDINTAVTSLAALHQRSRRHIKHVELEIPTYTEILERFSEIVRLSLRYCTGLKKFVIHTPFTLPGADGSMSASNTTVYANGFDILRWLPQPCNVILEGNSNSEIDAVVTKHLDLAKRQDKVNLHPHPPSLQPLALHYSPNQSYSHIPFTYPSLWHRLRTRDGSLYRMKRSDLSRPKILTFRRILQIGYYRRQMVHLGV